MARRRVERVQAALKEAVSEVVLRELKDPRVGFVTITNAKVTSDLLQAKVYYSVLGSEADQQRVAQCLQHARGFIRREVGRRLSLRFSPELIFIEDAGLKASLEIQRLIQEVRQEQTEHADTDKDGGPLAAGAESA